MLLCCCQSLDPKLSGYRSVVALRLGLRAFSPQAVGGGEGPHRCHALQVAAVLLMMVLQWPSREPNGP